MSTKRLLSVATATAAAAAALVTLAPSASAAPYELTGCETGDRFQKCLRFYNGGLGAEASIRDLDGGTNFDVRVNDIRYQRWDGDSWNTVKQADDFDGWHDVSDTARSPQVGLCSPPGQRIRAAVEFSWRAPDGTVVVQQAVTNGLAEFPEFC